MNEANLRNRLPCLSKAPRFLVPAFDNKSKVLGEVSACSTETDLCPAALSRIYSGAIYSGSDTRYINKMPSAHSLTRGTGVVLLSGHDWDITSGPPRSENKIVTLLTKAERTCQVPPRADAAGASQGGNIDANSSSHTVAP